ncbi:MAG: hypothetical protein ABI045_06825 [Flavobacteriales bacterium]
MSFFIWIFYSLLPAYFRVPFDEKYFFLMLIAGLFVLSAAFMGAVDQYPFA